jgi:hypothetical protein
MSSSEERRYGPVRPMTTNPGGVVDPQDLVGRDVELVRLLHSVETGGSKLLGDRRMGKTSLLRKLEEQLRPVGHTVIRVSAETSDPATFGRNLLDAMRSVHALGREWPHWEREFGGELKVNVGVFGLKLTAKASSGDREPPAVDLFQRCAEVTRHSGPYRLSFIFDEITVLARALGERTPGGADEFLRTLRVPRQELQGVSMILAGSIGLHHVVSDLSVVNDLDSVVVGPLTDPEALYLARCLLRGAGIARAHEVAIAETIAEQTCAIPFYIHKLVQELGERGMTNPRRTEVVDLVDDALRNDRWEMRHYLDRIPIYFGADAELVTSMLDAYAVSDSPLTVDDLSARLDAVDLERRPSRDTLLSIVVRLEADHYLVRVDAADRFATSLLRRAWRELRRLR